MRQVKVIYTIVDQFEIEDFTSPDEIEQMIEYHAEDEGFLGYVSDIEWDYSED